MLMEAEGISSPNIALVKYWGKYDQDWILPINDSIGITLSSEDLKTTTKIIFCQDLEKDELVLNGKKQVITKRLRNVLRTACMKAIQKQQNPTQVEWRTRKFRIQSWNSFPTASGMASSASGLACIAVCLNKLFKGCFSVQEVSEMARLGSGSASRSIFGGLVVWRGVSQQLIDKPQLWGMEKLSMQCISSQVFPASKLCQFKVIILMAHGDKKETSSTEGMRRSVQTSALIAQRNRIARQRVDTIIKSLSDNNINLFSQTIIRDSNCFHAICLDTYPPIHYLNDFSRQVMDLVDNKINVVLETKIAYTFDAGPHAFVIVHNEVFLDVLHFFVKCFQVTDQQMNERGLNMMGQLQNHSSRLSPPQGDFIKPHKLWVTEVGQGPMDFLD